MTHKMGQVNVETHQPHELADSNTPQAWNLALINHFPGRRNQKGDLLRRGGEVVCDLWRLRHNMAQFT
jgi:hypothetical protein